MTALFDLSTETPARGGFNIGLLFAQTAARLPDAPALIVGDRGWTFAEIERRIAAAAHALRSLGPRPGDRVLVQARNGLALFESCWAVWRAGAIWTPVNANLTPREVAIVAEDTRPAFYLCQSGFESHAAAVRKIVPAIRLVWIGNGPAGELTYEGLIADNLGQSAACEDVSADDPCWMFMTSGTTGRPKGALLGHGQMAAVVTTYIADILPGLDETHRSLAVAPLTHGAGTQMLPNVARGAATILTQSPRLDPEEVFSLIERHRVTNLFAVPTIVKTLVEHEAVDRFDHSSLRHLVYAGSPMYRADQKLAQRKLGPVLVQLYGLGEVTSGITVLPPSLHSDDDSVAPALSCGYARTGMEISIQDMDGNRRGVGETGEVCVRGQNVFLGYFNNPAANARSFRDGWFRTGDLGRLDAAGFLYLTGRESDMFISGGNNIYPLEIEEIILSHPRVSEVCVLGIEDARWGEIGVAVIVPKAGVALSKELFLTLFDGKLAKYKWPRQFHFWEALPKSAYGKTPKALVRDRLNGSDTLSQKVASR